jgi:hypothetical protein
MYISSQFHSLFPYFSAKKKDLLYFWSFLVALTVGYKIIHLPNSENIGHLRNTQAHFSGVIIFCFLTGISQISIRRLRSVSKLITYLESASKTESIYVTFKRFFELYFAKNFAPRIALVRHAMTHLQYFEYKWPRIFRKGYVLLPKDSP